MTPRLCAGPRCCEEAYTVAEPTAVDTKAAAAALRGMGQWLFAHLRRQERVSDGGSLHWFNSYYDDHGRPVEGVQGDTVRMMLTGQVFTLMSGAADDAQAAEVARAVHWYLFDPARGGCFLNTDFGEVKTDLGWMFGVRGIQGDLELDPRLTAAQFDGEDLAVIRCRFAGKVLTVQYHNPGRLEPEAAQVGAVTVDGRPLPMISRGRIPRAAILALPDGAVLTAELQPRTTH